MMESVSDDDLVDRSLDISPDMEEASDVDNDSSGESQQSQEDQAEEDMSQEGSDKDEQDKENEPLVTPEEGEEEQRNTAEEPPSTPASPSRAVRALSRATHVTSLIPYSDGRFVDPLWKSITPLSL